MNPEEKILKPLDYFPNVKRHIDRLPVKLQRETYRLVEHELAFVEPEYLSDADKLATETNLHDYIDYCMEEYYFHRKDIPND